MINTSTHNEDKQKPENILQVPTIYFRAAFILKVLSRLAIYVNNSQYLCHFCRRYLVVTDYLLEIHRHPEEVWYMYWEECEQGWFPVGTLDEATLIQGSREETLH